MNRRDFLKIAQFGLLGAMFPKNINLDYTGGEMELSEIFTKIANNQLLNPYEMDFLKSQGRDTQNKNSRMAQWTGADGNPQFLNPTIDTPIWKNALNSTAFDLTVDVPTASETTLVLDESYVRSTSKVFEKGATTRIKISTKNNFVINGCVSFQSNSTGYRKIALVARNKDAGGLTILEYTSPAVNGYTTNMSFSFIYDRIRIDKYNNFAMEEIEFQVYQNSGSTLATTCQAGLFEV